MTDAIVISEGTSKGSGFLDGSRARPFPAPFLAPSLFISRKADGWGSAFQQLSLSRCWGLEDVCSCCNLVAQLGLAV